MNNKPDIIKNKVVRTDQIKIHIHLYPIIFFCSGSLNSAKNLEIFTQKDTITVGLIMVKQDRKMPISVYVKLPVLSLIMKKMVGTKQ